MKDRKDFGKKLILAGAVFALLYGALELPAKRSRTAGNAESRKKEKAFYRDYVKRAIDKGLSFIGLLLLSPVYAVIALAIFFDDPGPVLFAQKRVGKDKQLFMLHKFRSMKMATPHDVPTHQLKDPERYITRVGKFLRKYSLDELPQVWDIFVGNMSIIGPRPALWNQADLVAERDKYGANDILPGLTGLAQINGRDELEIPEKARLDGEYAKRLRQGGWKALFFDAKCFLGTVGSVLHGDGVVEGGTGEMGKSGADAADFSDYGHLKHFDIDLSEENKKRVLITGAGSYIGQSFERWAGEHYPANFKVETLDMQRPDWREWDFSPYDAVFHVAGIAHADVGKVPEEEQKRYYAVNRDLAIETAKKAKTSGVRQFVFMSSMIVYGDAAPYGKEKVIDEHTLPAPSNFYGDSKWQADKGVRMLADDSFHVAVLRPPMVYGEGSKGNYPVLAKLAKTLPVFPDVENRRSMLHIDNLCEFLCKLMLSGEGGVYFPQNAEYTKTSEMVRQIAGATGKKIWITKLLKPAVAIGSCVPGKIGVLVNKAFGNSTYSREISVYEGVEYQVVGAGESVGRTKRRPHILVVSQYFYPETFRINDMVSEWVRRGHKVTVLTGIPNYPMGKFFDGYGYRSRRHERWKGADILRIPLIPRGDSRNKVLNSMGMAANYLSFVVSGWWWEIFHDIGADIVFTYEVSPMTQALVGVWYAKRHRIPHYLYVTDLWPENVESITGIHNRVMIAPIQLMVDHIYRHTDRILTSSRSFIERIEKRGMPTEKIEFWPQYAEEFYKPVEKAGDLLPQDEVLNLVFAGSVGFAQGLDVLVGAAVRLKREQESVRFHIIGNGRYLAGLQENIKLAHVEDYFNFIPRKAAEDIPKYLAYADAVLITLSKSDVFAITLPAKTQSYFACGRPIIVSADGEIQYVVRDAQAGFCSNAGDVAGLVANIKRFLEMKREDREQMGSNALEYSHMHFDKKELMDRLDKIFGFGMDGEVK